MKWKKLLLFCEKNDIKISRMGLYTAGLKNKFIVINEYGKLVFVKQEFKKWLERRNQKVPEGYIPIKECAAIWKKSLVWTYHIVKSANISTKRIGAKKLIYVNEKQFKRYLRECY